jgi:uncharacterized membrane-anchored protein
MFDKLKADRAENREVLEQLTEGNKKYYNQFILNLTNTSLEAGKNSQSLRNFAQEILDAQKAGKTAEEYFGLSAKELADQLVQELPNESFRSTLLTVLATGLIITLTILIFEGNQWHLWYLYLIITLAWSALIDFTSISLQRLFIKEKPATRNIIYWLVRVLLIGSLALIVFLLGKLG